MARVCESFPGYIIHPHRMATVGDTTAILGHTTGSHLGLPDEEESKRTLIWLSELAGGKVRRWTLIEDTPENRAAWGLV